MAFNSSNRSDVAGIIPEEYSNEFLAATVANSAVLSNFRTIQMGTKITRMPVLSALPSAGWVNEYPTSGHQAPTSKASWTNEVLTVEDVKVIVPIPINVIEDSTVDLFEYMRPLVGEAFGKVIDGTILTGTVTKPTSFSNPLNALALAAGQSVEAGRANKDLADDLSDMFAEVETVGFDVNTVFMGRGMRSRLRNLRDADGQFLYTSIKDGNGQEQVYGANVAYVSNGAWSEATGATGALAIGVDRSRLVVGMRSDMDYKMLTEATVDGINLAESDMVAMRVKMRLGWAINRGLNALGGTLPVALLRPDQTP
jgi:HK97 family phage major capsid protein